MKHCNVKVSKKKVWEFFKGRSKGDIGEILENNIGSKGESKYYYVGGGRFY
jgi:hypothetical protein